VVVDCGALAGGLMESELFGHVRGAFTGAVETRTGLVELAHGGTLFLDEVGELPMSLQAKLLGVLQRGRLTPVGGSQPRDVDVRVISATHRNLPRFVNEGLFRAELYYRLAVVCLRVPPLRERAEDIPLLVDEILRELRAREGEHVPTELSAVALASLLAQPWPGNVRELRNTVETAALAAAASGEPASVSRAQPVEPYVQARDRFLADYEERYLREALEGAGGNVSEAARRAGLDRRNFQRLLRRHNIDLRK
jgi:two-component system response regulator GlrR